MNSFIPVINNPPDEAGVCPDYYDGIKITSIYDLAEMLSKSDRVISLSR